MEEKGGSESRPFYRLSILILTNLPIYLSTNPAFHRLCIKDISIV